MQERNHEDQTSVDQFSVQDLFLGAEESFAEAQQRSIEENRSFSKTEFFRMDKLGTYRLRIMPVIPHKDGSTDRRGYEYPVRQLLLKLDKPETSESKTQQVYVTVVRATDAGYSVDLIDTYRTKATELAKSIGDDDLAEKISGGSFGGGLRYNYGHAMYVLDLTERAKGIQLLTLSHAQFKELEERKFKLWEKKLAKNSSHPCPVCSVYNAYPVEIEKKKNGSKTEYYISIDNESDTEVLAVEELNVLMATPRIPEVIYRYTRYHYEATLEFLRQCDIKYELQVMQTDEMQQAIIQVASEIPADDTSSFSFDKRSKDAKENAEDNKLSIDSLFDQYDEIQRQGLGDRTEEGQEFRAQLRTFIDQQKLIIPITRSTTNGQILELIEKAMSDVADPHPGTADDVEPEPVGRRK